MSVPSPFFSIIVVCRNPGPQLQTALGSVWSQTDADYEIVVVDGASTDGTTEWLEAQRDRLGRLISESDRGVYDAMNKGVAAARGEWILFLGSDDRLSDNVLAHMKASLQKTSAEVMVGEAVYDDGRRYRFGDHRTAARRNFVHHQAAFYRRTVFEAHGNFQTGLRIMADYEFNLRLVKASVRFEASPQCIAKCRHGGLSDRGEWTGYREEITVRHRHFPAWQCWPWDLGSLVRYCRKRIVRQRSFTR
jgi:putative colanic acid biosynthesis glycosyltransferase